MTIDSNIFRVAQATTKTSQDQVCFIWNLVKCQNLKKVLFSSFEISIKCQNLKMVFSFLIWNLDKMPMKKSKPGVVHLLAGGCSLIGCCFMGPRMGRLVIMRIKSPTPLSTQRWYLSKNLRDRKFGPLTFTQKKRKSRQKRIRDKIV